MAIVNTAASFSVSAWVRLDSLTGWRTAVNQDGVNVSGFWLQYSQALGNKFALTMHDSDSTSSAAYRAVSTTTAATGQWYHLVGVRDKAAGTMKLYVNGQLQATTAYAAAGRRTAHSTSGAAAGAHRTTGSAARSTNCRSSAWPWVMPT